VMVRRRRRAAVDQRLRRTASANVKQQQTRDTIDASDTQAEAQQTTSDGPGRRCCHWPRVVSTETNGPNPPTHTHGHSNQTKLVGSVSKMRDRVGENHRTAGAQGGKQQAGGGQRSNFPRNNQKKSHRVTAAATLNGRRKKLDGRVGRWKPPNQMKGPTRFCASTVASNENSRAEGGRNGGMGSIPAVFRRSTCGGHRTADNDRWKSQGNNFFCGGNGSL